MTRTHSLPTFARRWAPSLLAFGLLLGFSGTGVDRPARAQVDPPAQPTPTCETRCEAEARAVRQVCLDLGGTPEQCEARFRDTFERCMLSCQPEPTPETCEGRCALVGRQVYEACIASGRGPDDCEEAAAKARRECTQRECEPTRTPTPAVHDPTRTRTPAVNDPTRTPTAATCQGRCELVGRQAYEACIAGGGGPDFCERQAREAREACVKRECEPTRTPTPAVNDPTPETCETRCAAVRRDVLAACLAAGRGPDVCEREANEARDLCLRNCDRTATPTPRPEATAVTCEGRCARVAAETYERCIAGGGGADACELEANAARNRCLNECAPDRTATPRPADATPESCEARCARRARDAYEACIASGRGPDACEGEASAVKAACLRECPSDVPVAPGAANTACAERCAIIAREILGRCLASGGGEDRCAAEAEAAKRACVTSCSPTNVDPSAGTCLEKCAVHGRAVLARCLAEGGPEAACRERAASAERACVTACDAQPIVDCAGRCAARGRDVELACLSKGEDPAVCARAGAAAEASCRLTCSPPATSSLCATACRSLANVAYRRCIRSGGSFADCRVIRDRELAACIERCLRDQPLRP